jgi:hypothetical protein
MNYFNEYLPVIKWLTLGLLYIIDFLVIRVLEITFISIGFLVDYIVFFGVMFLVRKLFKKLKERVNKMKQSLSEK